MRNEQPFSQRLTGYLQNVDYRVAVDDEEREALYRLRYTCYRREGTISANSRKLFTDDYDEMNNCWLFGIYFDEELVSSIRFHVISPENPRGPAYDVFPDIVRPMIEAGMTVVDPTRLVVERSMTEQHPALPYVTIRAAFMAAEYFEAEYMLATVRREHQAFYMRYFGFEKLCDPRPYPTLLKPISLLAANMPRQRDTVVDRFPIFHSSFTERRMLFDAVPRPDFGISPDSTGPMAGRLRVVGA